MSNIYGEAFTALKFSFKDFFSKCDQICSILLIWSYLMKTVTVVPIILETSKLVSI